MVACGVRADAERFSTRVDHAIAVGGGTRSEQWRSKDGGAGDDVLERDPVPLHTRFLSTLVA